MDLAEFYIGYITCLNRQQWDHLGQYVATDVHHNDRPIGLSGYRDMLIADYAAIPDLRFNIELIAAQPPIIATRLFFDCHPSGEFLGLPVNGRRVRFAENVFYRLANDRIQGVWSVIDKAAIEAQLAKA